METLINFIRHVFFLLSKRARLSPEKKNENFGRAPQTSGIMPSGV
jgi:hypothetical protein